MRTQGRQVATWHTPERQLRAFEPTPDEIARFAPALADYYNDAHNRSMMANTVAMTVPDVVECLETLVQAGGRPFLLECNGEVLGDADFRHVSGASAEFAILVGRRTEQGKGLGLAFALLLHALAFRGLGFEQVFVSIIPANIASQRLFAKLGYVADQTPTARAFADDESDLTFSLGRPAFEARFGNALAGISWTERRAATVSEDI